MVQTSIGRILRFWLLVRGPPGDATQKHLEKLSGTGINVTHATGAEFPKESGLQSERNLAANTSPSLSFWLNYCNGLWGGASTRECLNAVIGPDKLLVENL